MDAFDVIRAAVWIFMFCVSVPLNLVCLIALRFTDEIEQPTKVFLLSLTVSELGACVLYVLPAIVTSITGFEPFQGTLCTIQYMLFNTCAGSIYTSLLAVNFERHIAVTLPLRYVTIVTGSRARISVLIIWLVSALHTILFSLGGEWKAKYDINIQVCLPVPPEEDYFLYNFMTIYTIVFMNIVLLITIALFVKLRKVVRRVTARIAELEVPSDSSGRSIATTERDIRIATTIFCMTLAIIFAVIPWEVVILLAYSGYPLKAPVLFFVEACFIAGGWLDVLVYYIRNRSIRVAAINVIKCKCAT